MDGRSLESVACNYPICHKYGDWGYGGFGDIECANCARKFFEYYSNSYPGVTCDATSIPGDPLHPGHISSIFHALSISNYLFVIVNGDEFLKRKKGAAFMPLKARCQVIASLRQDSRLVIVPFEPSNKDDMTVSEALEILRPKRFLKGGDRVIDNIPEKPTCDKLGIEIVTNIGDTKYWSSSDFLRQWDERKR